VVWGHTYFLFAIHYQLPHIPFSISWFQLRPTLIILKPDRFLSSQLSMTFDLFILGVSSRSTTEICPLSALVNYQSTTLFLLSHALSDLHDLSMRALFSNQQLRLISPFGLWESQILILSSSALLPPKVDDLSMRVPHRLTVVVHFALRYSGVSTLSLRFLP
jgi:hypothetical protein